jgi:transcriptional regulator with XRE-family HTH domain
MDVRVRELFKAERERLRLTQTAVATAAHVTQGTISKIEIEPDYEPSVSIFERAVGGLGLTLLQFLTLLEGQPLTTPRTEPHGAARHMARERDEGLAPLAPESERVAEAFRVLAEFYAQEQEKATPRHHRHAASAGAPSPAQLASRARRTEGTTQRTPTGRPAQHK